MKTLPVLMYHHVNPNKGDMITVRPEVFEEQMRLIREGGYGTLTLDELVGFIEGKFEVKEKSVAITFDDGYLDNYVYAFPVLKKYGIKAAVFLVSSWVDGASSIKGDRNALLEEFKRSLPLHGQTKAFEKTGEFARFSVDWDMVKEMRASGLVEFYSHTATHRSCDALSGEELKIELAGSKEALERALGSPCPYLCWPKGRFSPAALDAAREAGYRGVFTTLRGVEKSGGDPFNIKRIAVKDGARWLAARMRIYTSGLLSSLYLGMKR